MKEEAHARFESQIGRNMEAAFVWDWREITRRKEGSRKMERITRCFFFFPSPQGDPKGEKKHKAKQTQKFLYYYETKKESEEKREKSFIFLPLIS